MDDGSGGNGTSAIRRVAPSALVPADIEILRDALGATVRGARHVIAPSSTAIALLAAPGGDIVTAGTDGFVRRWSPHGRCLREAEAHPECWIHALGRTSDGAIVVTAGGDGAARAWRMEDLRHLRDFEGHASFLVCTDVSPDDTTLATGSDDRTARLWKLHGGEPMATLVGHTSQVTSLRFSPDGRALATGSHDRQVRFWSVPDGTPFDVPLQHVAQVDDILWSRDGNRLVTACRDGKIYVWRVWLDGHNGYRCGGELERVLVGHTKRVNAILFDTDEGSLLSASSDGTVRRWDLASGAGAVLLRSRSPCGSLALDAARGRLAVGAWCYDLRPTAVARVWSLDAPERAPVPLGVPVGETREAIPHPSRPGCLLTRSYDVDGRHRLVAVNLDTGDGSELWSVDATEASGVSWQPLSAYFVRRFDGTVDVIDLDGGHRTTLRGHRKPSGWVTATGDGRLLTAADDGTARMWDASDGRLLVTFAGHGKDVNGAALCPDGRHVVTTAEDGHARVWTADGRTVHVLSATGGSFWRILFHGSDQVMTGWSDGTVRIWNWQTGASVGVLEGHRGAIRSLERAPAGTLLVGDARGFLHEWDLATQRRLRARRLHRGEVRSASFREGGVQLVTAAMDGTVGLWDARSWTPIAAFYDLDRGFLWTTPPAPDAPAGWLATDRPELVQVVKAGPDGHDVPVSDEERNRYLCAYNNLDRVLERLGSAKPAPLAPSAERAPYQLMPPQAGRRRLA